MPFVAEILIFRSKFRLKPWRNFTALCDLARPFLDIIGSAKAEDKTQLIKNMPRIEALFESFIFECRGKYIPPPLKPSLHFTCVTWKSFDSKLDPKPQSQVCLVRPVLELKALTYTCQPSLAHVYFNKDAKEEKDSFESGSAVPGKPGDAFLDFRLRIQPSHLNEQQNDIPVISLEIIIH
uniref:DUF3715 domain-containing protein n=1 Tax=Angiostrongylus cantonensis TaxID=6313 RepID=A0A0K0D5L8_ANGCA